MLLLALLACCGPRVAPEAFVPLGEHQLRQVSGPWRGELVLAGDPGGVSAAWRVDGALWWSHAPPGQHGFAPPERVAEVGDGVPVLRVHAGVPHLAWVTDGRPHLASRVDGQWQVRVLSEQARATGPLDLALVNGEPVVAWPDHRAQGPDAEQVDLYAWFGGEEAVYLAGACPCSRPAVGSLAGRPAVAFHDLDLGVREVRLVVRGEGGWEDRDRVTAGGWTSETCPEGPVLVDGAIAALDARDGRVRPYRDNRGLPLSSEGEARALRGAPGVLLWLEHEGRQTRLVLDGVALALVTAEARVGDPVVVGDEVWLPLDGQVVAFPMPQRTAKAPGAQPPRP